MNLNTHLETIKWLNSQLDRVICRTNFLDEMITCEDNGTILHFLQGKLHELEKECIDIGKKIDFEKRQLYKLQLSQKYVQSLSNVKK